MNTEKLCLNCMAGYVTGGVCTHCGKTAGAEAAGRPQDALPAGRSLAGGRYCLGRVLGKGGYGITYLAWDRKWNRRIAIKELYPQSEAARDRQTGYVEAARGREEDYEHLKLRFMQEAQILRTLQQYPEIIHVYHLFEEYGTCYYAMEYLEGEDLGRYMKRNGKLSWSQLEPTIRIVLRSLQILHGKELFHRDISPNNIFLLDSGDARLIDFGSVRSYGGARQFTTILNASYAPYELWSANGNQGPWSDLYSLSITMYHGLTGILPPKAMDRIASRETRGADSARPLSSLHPDAPEYVQRAIEKGMSLDIPDRWRSAAEYGKALFPQRSGQEPDSRRKDPQIYTGNLPVLWVTCVKGAFIGQKFRVFPETTISLGRSAAAEIRYPEHMRTVSRNQCSFRADHMGQLYVRDEGSSNGTMLGGVRLRPGQWYPVRGNKIIRFADEAYQMFTG